MSEDAEDEDLFWVSPEMRGIIPLDGFRLSTSLRKAIRKSGFEVRVDTDFAAIIEGCATVGEDRDTTWINRTIRAVYGELFRRGGRRLDGGEVADVTRVGPRRAPTLLDDLGGLGRGGVVQVQDRDECLLVRQASRGGTAEARAGSGDDRDTVGEARHGIPLEVSCHRRASGI
jgi:hypothetical protein